MLGSVWGTGIQDRVIITSIQTISVGVIKVTASSGDVFLLRKDYLRIVPKDVLVQDEHGEVSDEAERDIAEAAECFKAEQAASALLLRAEQSRQGLMRKLIKRRIAKEVAARALDYLENSGALSDERYARAYLASRRSKADGRARLYHLLAQKGISRGLAGAALDEFFGEQSEEEACRKAVEKGLRQGKKDERLSMYLVRKGFSASMVRQVMKRHC